MKIALFDLDHTLLNIDSDHSWGQFLVDQGLVDAKRHQQLNNQFYQDYTRGELDPIAYNEFVFEFLSQHSSDELATLHYMFMQQVIQPQMRPLGQAAIDKHFSAGHTVVGITATSDFITKPIFQAFGIEHVIATEAEQSEGCFTGKVKGIPCYQQGKLQRLAQWLDGREVTESWAYSDSYNDRFLLEKMDHPVVVTPDDKLRTLAEQKQWVVLDWRFS